MAICRIEKNNNYTIISNVHLKDKNLSLKAIGLLSKVLSLPDNWDYTVKGLCAICKEEERAITSALNELKVNGYLIVNKIKPYQNNNFFSYEYTFYECPNIITEEIEAESVGVQSVGVQSVGVQSVGVQSVGVNKGHNQLNTKLSNTNQSNEFPKDVKTNINNIIFYLNDVLKTNYKSTTKKTFALIKARLDEEFTVEDFKTVIDKKHKQWKGTDMEKYLRPETLFGTKFEGYLNEKVSKFIDERNKVPDYGNPPKEEVKSI